jgi:hypothetical protein
MNWDWIYDCAMPWLNKVLHAADFPKEICRRHFDQTDMQHASEILNDTCAVLGNVPASLSATSTPEAMTAHCKDLTETCVPKGKFLWEMVVRSMKLKMRI